MTQQGLQEWSHFVGRIPLGPVSILLGPAFLYVLNMNLLKTTKNKANNIKKYLCSEENNTKQQGDLK